MALLVLPKPKAINVPYSYLSILESSSIFWLHELRHTNASMLIAQGVDVRTVAGLLGHAQPSTTLGIYSHAFDKNKRLAGQKLSEAMGL